MKYTLLFLALFFSKHVYSCCSSPLAEVIYKAEISKIDLEYENNKGVYVVTLENKGEIYGKAPKTFHTRINEYSAKQVYKVSLVKGKNYLVILYETGKHGNAMSLLPEKEWKSKELVLHPFIGIFNEESNQANLVIKSQNYFETNKWTNDFKFVNIFFWENP